MSQNSQRLFRVLVGEHGIYEAVEQYCPQEDSRRKEKPDGSWLPKVGEQFPSSLSFWTEYGLWRYIESGLFDWHRSVVDEQVSVLIAEERPERPEYEDSFQLIADEFLIEVDEFLEFSLFEQDSRFSYLFTTKAPQFETDRLEIKHVSMVPAEVMASYYDRNAAHFAPTDPTTISNEDSLTYTKKRMVSSFSALRDQSAYRFCLFEKSAPTRNKCIGSVGLSQVFRGPFQNGILGYGIDKEYEGKGLMAEAVQRLIRFAFEDLNLHRLEANHLIDNDRSAKLLNAMGFTRIGVAKDYLNVDGGWKDHCINQLINSSWKPQ